MALYHGADTSRYQGDIKDIKKFIKNIKFLAIRATVGDYYTDPMLDYFVKAAQDNDVVPMVYHVPAFHDGSAIARVVNIPIAIQRFLDAVGPYDIDHDGYVLDLEIVRGTQYQTRMCYKESAKELLRHITSLTWYSNANVGDTIMTPDASFWNKFFAWIASYTEAALPVIPKWLMNWHCWQYTSTGDGAAYGVTSKHIDLNWMKETMFKALTSRPGSTPEPEPEPEPPIEIPVNSFSFSMSFMGKEYSGVLEEAA